MLGSLGDIVFEAADNYLLSFDTLSFSRQANYSEHKILGRNGLVEFTGLNAGTASIKISLDATLGIDPLSQLELLERILNQHEAVSFVLNGQPIGSGYWVIESLNTAFELVDNQGRPRRISADISLKEYHAT